MTRVFTLWKKLKSNFQITVTVKMKECEKKKNMYSYTHPNIDIRQQFSVQGEQEELMEKNLCHNQKVLQIKKKEYYRMKSCTHLNVQNFQTL